MNNVWNRFRWVCLIAASALPLIWVSCGASNEAAQTPSPEEAAPAENAAVLASFTWKGEANTITLSELLQELEELPSYHKRRYQGRDGRATYLELMAESRIALKRAMELGLEDDPVVEAKAEELRRKILLDAVEKLEVADKVVVKDEDALDYYNRNLERYHLPERVRLLCLAVTDLEQAQGYLKEVKEGTRTFDEIVLQLSEEGLNAGPGGRNNGDTDLFARDSFVGAELFVEAAFALELGKMTEEVFSMEYNGETYHMLFRLEERAEAHQQTLEEVKDRVHSSAKRELTEAREAAWAEELEQIGQLTLYPDRLPEPPMRDAVEEAPEDETESGEEAPEDETESGKEESSSQKNGVKIKINGSVIAAGDGSNINIGVCGDVKNDAANKEESETGSEPVDSPPTAEKGKELVPADEVVFADLEMDAATVLAEWTWDGVQHTYTWGRLQEHFDGLRPYRKSRYAGVEGWTNLIKERALEELKLLEAETLDLGKTEKDLAQLEEYRRQLMIEQLYEKEITGMADVSEDRLMAYYEEHASEYTEPEKVRLICISLMDDKEAADQLYAELVGGRDIAEAAQTLSEAEKNVGPGGRNNGDTGLISRKTFSNAPAFTEAAFSTEVGQLVSEVVVQPLGEETIYYMIFRVEEKKPERQQTFDEVRSSIEREVGKIARQERLTEWLEELKERTNLVVYADRLPEDPPVEESEEETPEGETESEEETPDAPNSGNVEGDDNSPKSDVKIDVKGGDSTEANEDEAETSDEESAE